MKTATRLEDILAGVFDAARGGLRKELPGEEYERRGQEFVFHMMDWKGDLDRLSGFFNNPDEYDADAASKLVIGALYHIVPHLNAAGRILLDEIDDPFADSQE